MNRWFRVLYLSALVMFGALACCPVVSADAPGWYEPFFQYRAPLVVEVEEPGWRQVPLSAPQITAAINRLEEMAYRPSSFGYNHVAVVEADGKGAGVFERPDAGFYLVLEGPELIDPGWLGEQDTIEIPTEANTYYLLQYTSEGGGMQPAHRYRPIFPIGHKLRHHGYSISHEPRLLPVGRSQREQLLRSDGSPLELDVAGRLVRPVEDISLRKAQIVFLARFDRPGRHYWTLYYQPINGHNLSLPRRRHASLPVGKAEVIRFGQAEKFFGRTAHPLDVDGPLGAWFAETTVKLTPSTPAPTTAAEPAIHIAAAANEAQSFQLVLTARQGEAQIEDIAISELAGGATVIPRSLTEVQEVNFIPIVVPSYISPVDYRGPMGDALTAMAPRKAVPRDGNLAYWLTVRVPPGTAAGIYEGVVRINLGDQAPIRIPLELEVYGFELPEFSPFRSSMGGAHVTKPDFEGEKNVPDYHHISSPEDIRKLARKYYDVMARNKFTPHNCMQYSEIGMEWSPPPEGLNVDAPGNTFKLHSWDFTELNKDLRHYVDELKVNAFTLVHSNPSVITMFKHLPGKPLAEYNRHPGHLSLDWQVFREATWVGYDKRDGDPYTEITKAQYDDLVHQFYRAFAENLEKHGWLDYAYVLIDETAYRGYDVLVDFIERLKSDPLTRRIQIAWTIQSPGAFNYRQAGAAERVAFDGLLDIYVPETNENNHFWEKYFFTDYGIEPRREKLWNYVTYTTRSAIDTPGVNNRAIALEVFNNGGGGYLQWGTFQWDTQAGEMMGDNPWKNPYTRWSNGAVAYFYPPQKSGPSGEPDFTIVPSLRIMTYREGVDDFEYAKMLEDLAGQAAARGADVSEASEVLGDIGRFFHSTVHWSQNDAWYLDLRDRMARAIVALQGKPGE